MPQSKVNKERRATQRIFYFMPAKYNVRGSKVSHKAIACQDISGGGLRLLLVEPLAAKKAITVMLYPQDPSKPIIADCIVIWCQQCQYNHFTAGLKFTKLKNKQYFIDFLCEKMIDFSLTKGKKP